MATTPSAGDPRRTDWKVPDPVRTLLLITIVSAGLPEVILGQDAVQDTAPHEIRRPNANDRLESTPWSVTIFQGWTNNNTFSRTLRFMWDDSGEYIYSLDVAYTIPPTTGFGRFFERLLAARVQVGGTLSARAQPSGSWIPEMSAYAALRWRRLPWNHIVATSFAVGEGLSMVSQVPEVEINTTYVGGTSRLLNYVMAEVTLAVPSLPQVQLVTRVHHRSGALGVFGDAVQSGSNVVAIGFRLHR